MKKIVCPRCDNFLSFDETRYTEGQALRFHCPHCGRKFGIRITKKIMEENNDFSLGSVVILENQFGFRQEFPLQMGDNIIGRRSKGTEVQIAVLTSDPSMDRQHTVVNLKEDKNGKVVYTIRDSPSLVGTFLEQEIIGKNQRVVLRKESSFATLGATTIIVRLPEGAFDEE